MSDVVHSVSKLNTHKQCPFKYQQVILEGNFKDEMNEAAQFGNEQHLLGEKALVRDTPLSAEMGRALDYVRSYTGLKLAEKKLALDCKLKPCRWMQKDKKGKNKVWFRAIVDVTIMNGDHARIIDYKTGKRYLPWELRDDPEAKPDDYQMAIYAMIVFLHYPHLRTIDAELHWTHNGHEPDSYHYDKKLDAVRLLTLLRAEATKIESNILTGKWRKLGHKNAPGLCKNGHCPVKTCKHRTGK